MALASLLDETVVLVKVLVRRLRHPHPGALRLESERSCGA
jgi:hypothetical protein